MCKYICLNGVMHFHTLMYFYLYELHNESEFHYDPKITFWSQSYIFPGLNRHGLAAPFLNFSTVIQIHKSCN